VNGLLKIPKLALIYIHGTIILLTLGAATSILMYYLFAFLLFAPPIGIGLLLTVGLIVVPLLVGALNVFLLNRFYDVEGWVVGFWLNGLLLFLAFLTINVVLVTVWQVQFSAVLFVAEVFLLGLPFGYLARLSNN
jgi:hypothetical protein